MSLTVLFDVDGTLVDSNYLHTLAWWRACRELGIDAEMAIIHRLVGMGSDQLMPALVGREIPELDAAHARIYRAQIHEVVPLPGASELLAELHRRGATLGVATSSNLEDLRVLLATIPSSPLLEHIVSSDDVGNSKPAPDLALVALRKSGARPEEAIFVGDTRWDIEASGRAGLDCVAVTSGGWSPQELRDHGAVEVHQDPAALLAVLDDSAIGRRLAA